VARSPLAKLSTANKCFTSSATTHFGFQTVPLDQKQDLVKQVFQNVADSYDVMNDVMSVGVHRYWKDELLRLTHVESIARAVRRQAHENRMQNSQVDLPMLNILDVAGGTGDIAFRLFEAAQCQERAKSSGMDEIAITVCDINPDMLRVGQQRAIERFGLYSSKSLKFVQGNAQDLIDVCQDETYDLYTIAFGLRNVTDTDAALREAFRVLKPGGRFMCLEFSHVESHLFKQVYDWYSFLIIPYLGQLVANDRASYQYLVESIRQFDTQQKLLERMHRAGFTSVSYTNYTHGIVAIHQGWKPL